MMAQHHMGVFNFGTNEVFFSSFPLNSYQLAQKSQVYNRPISSIGSKCMPLRKSLDFDGRQSEICRLALSPVVYFTRKVSVPYAAQSSNVECIEKDLEFSPTFQDYLKVMESLKTDRKENVKIICKTDVAVPRRRTLERRGRKRFEENSGSRKSVLDKNISSKKSYINKNVRDKLNTHIRPSRRAEDLSDRDSYGKSNIVKQTNDERDQTKDEHSNVKEMKRKNITFEKLQRKSIIESKTDRKFDDGKYVSKSDNGESLIVTKQDENIFKRVYIGKAMDDIEMNHGEAKGYYLNVDKRNLGDVNNMRNSKTLIRNTTNRYVRGLDNFKTKGKDNYITTDMKGRSGAPDNHLLKFGVKEDRAAFKTFEVFTDVRNRPRVLRMELEEKLHKLAKWLNATDINMPEWQFSKIIHGAKIKFTEHSILRIVQILGELGNWRRALQIVQWLQSRERFKTYKSRYIYTSVLDVLGKAKRPIEALNVFYAMREEFSSYPDLAAYHCISVTLGQAGLMSELFDVIDCMRALPEKKFNLGPLQKWDPRLEPDLVVYNAVLNACVRQKKWEGAFWVLQQLKQHNIQPTNTTLGLIMEVMLECGKYNLVHEFFRQMEQTSIPSALNYKVLVNTLWREHKADEAVLAVKDMERRGVVGSASLYYDLARCLCSAGRCQEALLQIDKICKVAKKPLVVTYTGLIQACLDSGNIEDGKYVFNEMHKYCSPNTITCNIMLKSYIHHEMYDDAYDLFQKILDGSHQIRNKYDADQNSNPDKYTFNTMMDACAATKHWDDFEYTYEQMLNHGFHFDSRRHLRLVMDAFRAGKRRIIETTWEHLISFGRDPPLPIIQERFCIKLEEDDYLAALLCIKAHNGKEMHAFSQTSWLYLLKNNAHRFKEHSLLRLSHELNHLIEESDTPCLVHKNLLDACKELANI